MKEKRRGAKKPAGFWARTDPCPAAISVRGASSKLSRSLAFLRKILGWGRTAR
jgi:hypothetical protein